MYPLRIVRPIEKNLIDLENHLQRVLSDLEKNNLRVKHFVADNPKRAKAKMVLNHASLHPCEYCFARGCRHQTTPKNMSEFKKKIEFKKKLIQEKKNDLQSRNGTEVELKTLKNLEKDLIEEEKNGPKTKSKIVWPASSRDAESRTNDKIRDIITNIEENPNLSKNDRKGVVGRSPLWDIPDFDFTRDVPTEYMHTSCLGVVKRMIELTFSVGDPRPRETKRKLSSATEFDLCMIDTKVPREFPRRARKLDFAVMKAVEMRNISLYFFPYVLQCIEPNAKERKLWLLLAYSMRSCTIPSNEFSPIDLNDIETACREFYELYEKIFGAYNCSYNTHVFGCHLIEMRSHGPLTETSAFVFESFYGEMRNAFTPGTQSTLKQIMQKTFIKRAISFHCCKNSIYYSPNDSPMECNSLIYCYERNVHNMYKIIEVEKESLLCYKQGKYPVTFPETSSLNLNWSQVGVYKKGGVMETPIIIPKTKVSGKVINVGNYLITSSNNILLEK